MEILKRGFPSDFIGLVAQDIENRVGGEEDVGIRGEVWRILESARGREFGLFRLDLL